MDYELAQKLKDAGFPMPTFSKKRPILIGYNHTDICPPTLEELIEACGKNLHCLVHTTDGGLDSDREFWSAGKDNIVMGWVNGPTPKEAVAYFWLTLNKK